MGTAGLVKFLKSIPEALISLTNSTIGFLLLSLHRRMIHK